MKKRILEMAAVLTLLGSMFAVGYSSEPSKEPIFIEETVTVSTDIPMANATVPTVQIMCLENDNYVSDEEIELLALVTMAEAEGECDEGKRLVIDTILNRVDHERFPSTITDVIYQPNQFTSMWNDRVNRCQVTDEVIQLVKEELQNRQDTNVIFFSAGGYSNYGTPLYSVENHYFSKY